MRFTGRTQQFVQILLNRADSIYPEIKQELSLIIEDRLNAIQAGLTELNAHQKAELIESFQKIITHCDRITRQIKPILVTAHAGLETANA